MSSNEPDKILLYYMSKNKLTMSGCNPHTITSIRYFKGKLKEEDMILAELSNYLKNGEFKAYNPTIEAECIRAETEYKIIMEKINKSRLKYLKKDIFNE